MINVYSVANPANVQDWSSRQKKADDASKAVRCTGDQRCEEQRQGQTHQIPGLLVGLQRKAPCKGKG